jgi:hypothetical protein
VDHEFQEIADTAIEAAEAIECEGSEFVAGLEVIFDALKQRLEEAREEFGE